MALLKALDIAAKIALAIIFFFSLVLVLMILAEQGRSLEVLAR